MDITWSSQRKSKGWDWMREFLAAPAWPEPLREEEEEEKPSQTAVRRFAPEILRNWWAKANLLGKWMLIWTQLSPASANWSRAGYSDFKHSENQRESEMQQVQAPEGQTQHVSLRQKCYSCKNLITAFSYPRMCFPLGISAMLLKG